MTPPDDLLKRARQIHRTDSREIIEELVAALESDRALLRRIGDALNTWDATAPTVLNAPTSLFVRTVRSIIDEARARIGEGK